MNRSVVEFHILNFFEDKAVEIDDCRLVKLTLKAKPYQIGCEFVLNL